MANLDEIKILLAYACHKNIILYQIDAKNTSLNGEINEELYRSQPPGFIDVEKLDHVLKLSNALYGLK